ncbi:HAD family phosphatase [Dysgonomonas sp. Marseille-P4361]|uniref:HAD family hydrolase n=1 Tax=Dysgonomonas sp. Marseille-P4361 TaxID=2161820 RepID=UPI000D562255|nr:HAD family phosphatase [Dysgonomonas sp. Marseille-P4361]
MIKKTTILFDFDGVIADTEPQYDLYMDTVGSRYNSGIENFASAIKGTIMPDIMEKYFSHLSDEEKQKLEKEVKDFELVMDFPLVDGVVDFIDYLKKNNFKIGLVTSSPDYKMERALRVLNMEDTFGTKVTASDITIGKPNPMCYLLAAKNLNSDPKECIVFEDSFHGIQAGKSAGMKVVGLSTTIPTEQLKEKVEYVMPDFSDKGFLIKVLEE